MSIPRDDAEAIRDAVQELVFFQCHQPKTLDGRSYVESAWRTIDRLTRVPIEVPGHDSSVWTFKLREAAWKVCCGTYSFGVSITDKELQSVRPSLIHLRGCQDTLRCVVGSDELPQVNNQVKQSDEATTPQGSTPQELTEAAADSGAVDSSDLPPSRLKAVAVCEWAIETISEADSIPIRDLYQKILKKLDATIAAAPPGAGEAERLQELRDSLPTNSETFGKYLRDAGIKRYNTQGERTRRISHFKRRDEA